jgi:DNA-binding beta-propeller fold protein YncE
MRITVRTFQYIFIMSLFCVFGIEHCVKATMLYCSDSDTNALYLIDTTTAKAELVGYFEIEPTVYYDGIMAGLAYDSKNDIMYGTTTDTNRLYSIDYRTGKATEIGKLNAGLMHGLDYDESTDTLYGTYGDPSNNHFYQIDVTTGNSTIIGDIGINRLIGGLSVHPETYDLYGASSGRGGISYLIKIDKNTGAGTLLYEYRSFNMAGLAFSPNGILYATDNWTGNLYTIDLLNGSKHLIGNTGLINALGLTSIPEPTTIILLAFGGLSLFLRKNKYS